MYIAFVQKSDSVMRHHHLANPMGAKLVCVALVEVDPHLRGGLPRPRERVHQVEAAETVLEEEHAAGGET
jgi:hypothetical protein